MKSLISVLNIFFHENSYLTALIVIFRLVVRVTVFAYSSTLGNNVAGETKLAFLGTSLQNSEILLFSKCNFCWGTMFSI
jgi:Na+/alanine symporter